jgi:hypothetical protein
MSDSSESWPGTARISSHHLLSHTNFTAHNRCELRRHLQYFLPHPSLDNNSRIGGTVVGADHPTWALATGGYAQLSHTTLREQFHSAFSHPPLTKIPLDLDLIRPSSDPIRPTTPWNSPCTAQGLIPS